MSGVERKDDPSGAGGPEEADAPKTEDSNVLKVRVSPDDLVRARAASERFKADRASRSDDGGDLGSSSGLPPPPQAPASGRPDGFQLLAIFCGVAGLGSLVALEPRVVFPTLLVAFAALAFATHGRTRFAIGALAVAALGCAVFAWVSHISAHSQSSLGSELSKANMRLEVVDEVNGLRLKHHLRTLNYDPELSLVAQQRADYAAAGHSGFATTNTAGRLPSEETNMWAEIAGVACSWKHLFELQLKELPTPDETEIGFMEDRADRGSTAAYLSPAFHSIGVGVEEIPGGDISLVMDFTGPPKADVAWQKVMPNMMGVVVGNGIPDCS